MLFNSERLLGVIRDMFFRLARSCKIAVARPGIGQECKFLRRWIGKCQRIFCMLLMTILSNSKSEIFDIKFMVSVILEEEKRLAKDHLSNPYYTDMMTGRNVGQDEQVAVWSAEGAYQIAVQTTSDSQFIDVFMKHLWDRITVYRKEADDPDGYGVGTLHSIVRKTKEAANELGIEFTEIGEPVGEDGESFNH